jgi:oligopeptide/dipeptide ABC transporter ATP-binding protein
MTEPILRITGLVKEYRSGRGTRVRAVAGVDLDVARGSTLAVVGESGCGKTTLARCIVGAVSPTTGRIDVLGQELSSLRGPDLRRLRARLGFVQQNPAGALDPTMQVRDVIAEPLRTHRSLRGSGLEKRIRELIDLVSLTPGVLDQRPNELSGGQAQRVAIARAIALGPELLVLDEPTSALDLSVQAQILNLLLDLQHRLSLTYVLISHDLDVVEHLADDVAVMYLGRIVERANPGAIRASARHPYTVALFSATPSIRTAKRVERIVLRGDVPDPAQIGTGCPFRSRCWLWEWLGRPDVCREREPDLLETADGHLAACHFAGRLGSGVAPPPAPQTMPRSAAS